MTVNSDGSPSTSWWRPRASTAPSSCRRSPSGDFVRSETIALHGDGSTAGAQFYMGCAKISATGGKSGSPVSVKLSGAYKATGPLSPP
jgi:hypothetical protein